MCTHARQCSKMLHCVPHVILRDIFWEDIAGMTHFIDKGPRFVGSKQV